MHKLVQSLLRASVALSVAALEWGDIEMREVEIPTDALQTIQREIARIIRAMGKRQDL